MMYHDQVFQIVVLGSTVSRVERSSVWDRWQRTNPCHNSETTLELCNSHIEIVRTTIMSFAWRWKHPKGSEVGLFIVFLFVESAQAMSSVDVAANSSSSEYEHSQCSNVSLWYASSVMIPTCDIRLSTQWIPLLFPYATRTFYDCCGSVCMFLVISCSKPLRSRNTKSETETSWGSCLGASAAPLISLCELVDMVMADELRLVRHLLNNIQIYTL
jgi:hypothetical protein